MMQTATTADEPPIVTFDRINELVDVIVPKPGCAVENGEAAALALVELLKMATGDGYAFTEEIDSGCAVYFIARAAFTRTGVFEAALEDWQDNIFESALKKGGAE